MDNNLFNDTITAISTPPGTGGIGIVRISGSQACEIISRIFRKSYKSNKDESAATLDLHDRKMSYGVIVDSENENEVIDEVMTVIFKGPNSYTREDIVEIQCHGGFVTTSRILSLVIKQGARIAEPGEFTKRAFLNGRIDLAQAEAVIELIHAKTRMAARASVNQLEGKLSKNIMKSRQMLVTLMAEIEVAMDYPEHDDEPAAIEKVEREIKIVEVSLNDTLKSAENGAVLKDGIRTALTGRTNVGKSSLLNALAGKSRAIVTDIPGTTRDILEEEIQLNGLLLCIVDTAGIRHTEDIVEKIGVDKAQREAENAELVLFVIDASEGVQPEDKEIAKSLEDKKVIVVYNKADLLDGEVHELDIASLLPDAPVVKVSALREEGLENLEKEIAGMFLKGGMEAANEAVAASVRHQSLIGESLRYIGGAKAAINDGMTLDCIIIDIRNAAEALGKITGESVTEEMVNEIFHRFCVGK